MNLTFRYHLKTQKTTIVKTLSPIGQITTTTHQQTAFQPTKAKQ
jgi:hypothetical protein